MTEMRTILVWDWPVRIGHWLLAGAFVLAWLTGDSETWRLVHAYAGGSVVGVIVFRLLWGLIGTRHARFANFIRGPQAVRAYIFGLLSGHTADHAGHNAAGGWAIVALLLLGLAAGFSGWVVYQDIGGEWLEEVHEVFSSLMLAVVLLHLAGVVVSSLAHRENLVRAMLTGYKRGLPDDAIASARPVIALLLLAWVVLCAWVLSR
jgi:cytochrome b